MLYTLQKEQVLKSDLTTVWHFMSSPLNLAEITPDAMGFKVLSDLNNAKMHAGQIIEYKVSPIMGINLHWVTEITHVEEGKFFVDEQRFGPYAFWHHQHHLEETPAGVLMKDLVHYKLPLGILGRMANALFVRKQLEEIFSYRYNKLETLFNKGKL